MNWFPITNAAHTGPLQSLFKAERASHRFFESELMRVQRCGQGRLEGHFHGTADHHFWEYKRPHDPLPHWEWDTHL